MAMTGAERMARLRQRQRAGERPVRYRQPKDTRRRSGRWSDAVDTLLNCLDAWQAWRERMPVGFADSELAERLDAMHEMRELVEQLAEAEPPSGFGRD